MGEMQVWENPNSVPYKTRGDIFLFLISQPKNTITPGPRKTLMKGRWRVENGRDIHI